MGKECWVGPAHSVEQISRPFGLLGHPLELAAYPPDDIGIDPLQGRTQLRLVEAAVVGDPAADAWVVHLGQFGQGLVAAMMKRPAADILADARQCLRADGGLKTAQRCACPSSPTLSFGLETGSRESQNGCWESRRAG